MSYRRLMGRRGLVWALTMVILGSAVAMVAAQQSSAPNDGLIHPTLQYQVPPAQLRTWGEMEADFAAAATGPAPAPKKIIFRPTMGTDTYAALKGAAGQTGVQQAPLAPEIESATPLAPTTLSNPINFEGVDSVTAGDFYPPDTHGGVGLNHFVEITNSHLDIYLKTAPNTRVKSVTLESFFGYSAASLFDPRVIFDPVFNRWIITAEAFPESANVQKFFFAVSQSADPTSSFWIYNINVNDPDYGANSFWDFPQLGMDQNAIIFTANLFNGNSYVDARMFAVAKSLIYSGQSFTLNMFTGLVGTLAPPIVLDVNTNTYLAAADAPNNKVTLYTLTNSAANPPTLSVPAFITVPNYTVPPNAPQPGTSAVLDSMDGRFVNVSTQIGNSLFQVHTINIAGFARPKFYEFDTVNRVVIQSGTFSRSATSSDFNASIAANKSKDVFVTWSATDPTNNINAEVRFSGRLHTDTQGLIPSPGSLLFGSSTFYRIPDETPQRWGDYSAVSLDPVDTKGLTAWIVNERILTSTTWGSRIGSIKLPAPLPGRSLLGVYMLLLLN